MTFFRLIVLIFSLNILSFAEDKQIKEIFKKANIKGTIVISSLNEEENYIYNTKRASMGFLPASTFKIPNTLIALQEKVIKNEYEVIKWDGKKRFYEPWNKNQNLQTALKYSCVWCYQKFASKIGNKKYLKYLTKINYGNKKTGLKLTTFWLNGNLRISAKQQISFLKKLYKNNLPFEQKYIDITKKILTVEKTANYIMKAKTGWSTAKIWGVGWYVGYVENKNNTYFFALNIDITDKSQLKYRTELVTKILKIKDIIN